MQEQKDNKSRRTEMKDFGRIAALNNLFEESGYKNAPFSEISGGDGNTAVVNRLMLEGIDFDLTYTPMKYLGYKAVVNAIGALYAGCYTPIALDFTIAVSAKFSMEHLQTLWSGVLTAAKVYEIKNVTLDITSSLTGLTISCSASGVRGGGFAQKNRSPKSGDLICVTGDLGASYMGLHVLMREKAAFNESKEYKQPDLTKYKYLLSRYLAPEADSFAIQKMGEIGVYPLDGRFITRGLGDAVKSLCAANNLGARIYIDKIPIATQTSEMAKEINIDIITAVVNGGDDCRLLYLFPLEEHEKIEKCGSFEILGHFVTEPTAELVSPDGENFEIKAQGW